jgi:hypothetical protein
MSSCRVTFLVVLGFVAASPAADVLVLSSTNQAIDNAALQALNSRGHHATLGPAAGLFDGTIDLSPYDAAYLQMNQNWNIADMPSAGQASLLAFIESGGGLVTGEWTLYDARDGGTWFKSLEFAFPGEYQDDSTAVAATFTSVTPDPVLNAGLPDSFDFPLDSFGGTESIVTAKCGATTFYRSSSGGAGLTGWDHKKGRILNFSSTNGPTQLADPEFGTLLANAVAWAAAGGDGDDHAHTADCDGTGALDLFDFLCFNNRFVAQQEYADCTGDGIFELFDFLCFVNVFNQGC